MNRVEENKKIIDHFTKSAKETKDGTYYEMIAWHLGAINSFSADISKSLAVIADNMPRPVEPIKCACTDDEVEKSFISDVESVKDLLPDQKMGLWYCSVDTCEAICSNCNTCIYEPFNYAQSHFKYCPICGQAKLIKEESK